MAKFKTARWSLIASVALLALLADFSVLGAFAGADRAKLFFNSMPLVVFWCVLLALLVSGFFVFPGLRKRKMMLLIHAGLVLVLAGGMYGSALSHALLNRFAETPTVTRAFMFLPEGHTSGLALLENNQVVELPFEVHLKRAWLEYYDQSRMVKDYKSVLEIIDDGTMVKTGEIEVNKPLYYRGYHFYQNTFNFEGSTPVSGLLVVSARGVWLVFAGYALILIGLFGHFGRVVFAHKPVQEGVQ
jgi:predicted Rossmann-fold nucleotide-binding protein